MNASPRPAALLSAALMIGLGILFLLLSTHLAKAADYYQWENENGSLSYTDDPKLIPAKYKETASARSWAELQEKTDSRLTVVEISNEAYLKSIMAAPIAEEEAPLPSLEDCDQPVRSLPPVYRQVGDYSRLVYRYADECGNVISSLDGQLSRILINR